MVVNQDEAMRQRERETKLLTYFGSTGGRRPITTELLEAGSGDQEYFGGYKFDEFRHIGLTEQDMIATLHSLKEKGYLESRSDVTVDSSVYAVTWTLAPEYMPAKESDGTLFDI